MSPILISVCSEQANWLNVFLEATKVNPGQASTVTCTAVGFPSVPKDNVSIYVTQKGQLLPKNRTDFVEDISLTHQVQTKYRVTGVEHDIIFHCQVSNAGLWKEETLRARLFSKLSKG